MYFIGFRAAIMSADEMAPFLLIFGLWTFINQESSNFVIVVFFNPLF